MPVSQSSPGSPEEQARAAEGASAPSAGSDGDPGEHDHRYRDRDEKGKFLEGNPGGGRRPMGAPRNADWHARKKTVDLLVEKLQKGKLDWTDYNDEQAMRAFVWLCQTMDDPALPVAERVWAQKKVLDLTNFRLTLQGPERQAEKPLTLEQSELMFRLSQENLAILRAEQRLSPILDAIPNVGVPPSRQ